MSTLQPDDRFANAGALWRKRSLAHRSAGDRRAAYTLPPSALRALVKGAVRLEQRAGRQVRAMPVIQVRSRRRQRIRALGTYGRVPEPLPPPPGPALNLPVWASIWEKRSPPSQESSPARALRAAGTAGSNLGRRTAAAAATATPGCCALSPLLLLPAGLLHGHVVPMATGQPFRSGKHHRHRSVVRLRQRLHPSPIAERGHRCCGPRWAARWWPR